jgi:hypothetical protein
MAATDLIPRWIEALRSGDYEQAEGRLMKGSGSGKPGDETMAFCCLGVLCDIIEIGGWEYDDEEDEHRYAVDHSSSFELLPDYVQDRTGLSPSGGFNVPVRQVEVDGVVSFTSKQPGTYDYEQWRDAPLMDSLVEMNDDGASFKQIADLLDSEFDAIFEPTHRP